MAQPAVVVGPPTRGWLAILSLVAALVVAILMLLEVDVRGASLSDWRAFFAVLGLLAWRVGW